MGWGWAVAGVVVGLLAGYVVSGLHRAHAARRGRRRADAWVEGVLASETIKADRSLIEDLTASTRVLRRTAGDPESARALRDIEAALVHLGGDVTRNAEESTRLFWLGMAIGALLAIIGIGFTLWTASWA